MGTKRLLAVAAVVAVALVVAGTALSRPAATPTLKGVVGPGYSISLTKGGKRVKTLKAGKYKFVISDKSDFHNFTVEREKPSSPKIEKHITGTGFVGKKTMVMTLKPGSWSFYCSNHESQMHGDFKVKK
jgi:plastocyanin